MNRDIVRKEFGFKLRQLDLYMNDYKFHFDLADQREKSKITFANLGADGFENVNDVNVETQLPIFVTSEGVATYLTNLDLNIIINLTLKDYLTVISITSFNTQIAVQKYVAIP